MLVNDVFDGEENFVHIIALEENKDSTQGNACVREEVSVFVVGEESETVNEGVEVFIKS